MLKAKWMPYRLLFKEAAATSRSVMIDKETYFIKIYDVNDPQRFGIGVCALFRGLSAEDTPGYEQQLDRFCNDFDPDNLPEMSSVRFGVESALADMELRRNQRQGKIRFRINGLIWMGDKQTMYRRICEKLDAGFKCLKLKIGGIDFNEEIDLLKFIRSNFDSRTLELRLDANGSFTPENALCRLHSLSRFDIHSIEQPVKAGQPEIMAEVVARSPVRIALDEELIGVRSENEMEELLDTIKPHFIILKPSLCGGFRAAEKWIEKAGRRNIGWWATSALESNVGLTAIAMWLSEFDLTMPQGLGTGALYRNNISGPLSMEGEQLVIDLSKPLPYLPF